MVSICHFVPGPNNTSSSCGFADIDSIDPGYAFINRGSITAQPTDPDRGTAPIVMQGASSTYITCLSSMSNGTCNTTPQSRTDKVTTTVNGTSTTSSVSYTAGGGLLNTGTIAAQIGRAHV